MFLIVGYNVSMLVCNIILIGKVYWYIFNSSLSCMYVCMLICNSMLVCKYFVILFNSSLLCLYIGML